MLDERCSRDAHQFFCIIETFEDLFYFLLLDERCDVDHDDDGEEAHKNRATDKKRNIALASCGLYCCHAWQQCHESDK